MCPYKVSILHVFRQRENKTDWRIQLTLVSLFYILRLTSVQMGGMDNTLGSEVCCLNVILLVVCVLGSSWDYQGKPHTGKPLHSVCMFQLPVV